MNWTVCLKDRTLPESAGWLKWSHSLWGWSAGVFWGRSETQKLEQEGKKSTEKDTGPQFVSDQRNKQSSRPETLTGTGRSRTADPVQFPLCVLVLCDFLRLEEVQFHKQKKIMKLKPASVLIHQQNDCRVFCWTSPNYGSPEGQMKNVFPEIWFLGPIQMIPLLMEIFLSFVFIFSISEKVNLKVDRFTCL